MNGKRNRENRRKNHYTAIWLPCVLTAAAVTFLLWDGTSAGGEMSDSQTVQANDMAGEEGRSGIDEGGENPDGGEAQRENTDQAGVSGPEGTSLGDSSDTALPGELSGQQDASARW